MLKTLVSLCAGLLLAGCVGNLQGPRPAPTQTIEYHHDIASGHIWCEIHHPDSTVYHYSALTEGRDACRHLR